MVNALRSSGREVARVLLVGLLSALLLPAFAAQPPDLSGYYDLILFVRINTVLRLLLVQTHIPKHFSFRDDK